MMPLFDAYLTAVAIVGAMFALGCAAGKIMSWFDPPPPIGANPFLLAWERKITWEEALRRDETERGFHRMCRAMQQAGGRIEP